MSKDKHKNRVRELRLLKNCARNFDTTYPGIMCNAVGCIRMSDDRLQKLLKNGLICFKRISYASCYGNHIKRTHAIATPTGIEYLNKHSLREIPKESKLFSIISE